MSNTKEFVDYIKALKNSKDSNDMRKTIFLNKICSDYNKFYISYVNRYSKNKIYTYKEELNFYKKILPSKVIQEINSKELSDDFKLLVIKDILKRYINDIYYMCYNRHTASRSRSRSKSKKRKSTSQTK